MYYVGSPYDNLIFYKGETEEQCLAEMLSHPQEYDMLKEQYPDLDIWSVDTYHAILDTLTI